MRWSRVDGISNAVDRLQDFFAVTLIYWRVLIAHVAPKDFSVTSKISLDVEQFLPEGFVLFLDIDQLGCLSILHLIEYCAFVLVD